MSKASGVVAVLGSVVLFLFVASIVLACLSRTVGPLPVGVSSNQSVGDAPRTIFMFKPAELLGKAPPKGAKTIPLETFQNLGGDFWNGVRNPEYRSSVNSQEESAKEPLSKFWRDLYQDASYYGQPRAVADEIWADSGKRAKVEAMGIRSAADLLKVFQTDRAKSQKICLETGEGFYVTAQKPAGLGGVYPAGEFGMYTVGFKPFSDLWDPTVTSGAMTGLLTSNLPDDIIQAMRKQGYADSYIKVVFENFLKTHGSNFQPDVTWREGNLDGWWSGDAQVRDKQVPLVVLIREPTWMEITSVRLQNAGGTIRVPNGTAGWYIVDKPVLIVFNMLPSEDFFRDSKLDIGVLKGGRDLISILHGDYLKELRAVRPVLWKALCDRPSVAVPPDILADYSEWCVRRDMAWAAVGHTTLPPSKLLKEILGDEYLKPSASVTTAELGLYLKGDSLARKVFSNPSGVFGLTGDEARAWKEKVRAEYTAQAIGFMEPKIRSGSESVSYYDLRGYVQWLKDMGKIQEASWAEKNWYEKEVARQSLSPWIERNKNKSPEELGAVDSYVMQVNGREWNLNKHEWELSASGNPPSMSSFIPVLQEKSLNVSSPSRSNVSLQFPSFTMALFSPDYSYCSFDWSGLRVGSIQISHLWWPLLAVAILAAVLPSLNWKKARGYY